jgi:hypothetical protein
MRSVQPPLPRRRNQEDRTSALSSADGVEESTVEPPRVSQGLQREEVGRLTGESGRIYQRPAVRALTDFHAPVVHRRNGEAHFLLFYFEQLGAHCDALADFRRRQVAYVDMDSHRLLVTIEVGLNEQHTRAFHQTDHRRGGKDIGDQLAGAHFFRCHVRLLMLKPGNQAVFHARGTTRNLRAETSFAQKLLYALDDIARLRHHLLCERLERLARIRVHFELAYFDIG